VTCWMSTEFQRKLFPSALGLTKWQIAENVGYYIPMYLLSHSMSL